MADDDTASTEQASTGPDETSETGTTESESTTTEEAKPKSELPPEAARALRKANKEAETYRLRLKEYEDRDKTEQQKATEKAAAAEKELDALRAENLRSKVALSKGLPAELAERLRGDDEESLAADADKLLALVAQKQRPGGDVDQGHRGGDGPKQVTEAQLKQMTPEQIVKAQEEGRLTALLA